PVKVKKIGIMKKIISAPRGTTDILPEEAILWQFMENEARRQFFSYGYQEIRTPMFEETELFARSMGQTSDIVQKQMLNLAAQGVDAATDSSLSLRPEGTAAIVRSYIENNLDKRERLSKFFYIAPMFRGERPQKGRLRQFHQIGVEAIGPDSTSPYLDAEIISLSVLLLQKLGVNDFILKLNTLGTIEDKNNFSQYLRKQIGSRVSDLCPDCQNRYERNVFRVLDCKNKSCKEIVKDLELNYSYLSETSRRYYESVKAALDSLGIVYHQQPDLVRGLDYYTHTVFELSCNRLGSQDALGAGGRYNHLVQELGGPEVGAVGFALGMERIILARPPEEIPKSKIQVYVIALGERFFPRAFQLLQLLRENKIAADMNFSDAGLKSQMRQANKSGADFVMMIGEEEFINGMATVKNMSNGSQEQISLDKIQDFINERKA
ncbi:MAG: histidine--tRNA ligase, partial [Candidatus Omnitrophota bacterium]